MWIVFSSPDSVNFLPASVCAERIVQGVITNQKFLYIPKSYRLLEFLKRYQLIKLVIACELKYLTFLKIII